MATFMDRVKSWILSDAKAAPAQNAVHATTPENDEDAIRIVSNQFDPKERSGEDEETTIENYFEEEAGNPGLTPEEEEAHEAYMLAAEEEAYAAAAEEEARPWELNDWGPEQEQAAINGYYDRLMREVEIEQAERDYEASLPSEDEVLDRHLASEEARFHAQEKAEQDRLAYESNLPTEDEIYNQQIARDEARRAEPDEDEDFRM